MFKVTYTGKGKSSKKTAHFSIWLEMYIAYSIKYIDYRIVFHADLFVN